MDMFGVEIPDPHQIKSQTRDTLTIRDVLQPSRPSTGGIAFMNNPARTHDNSLYESTPNKIG